MAVLLSACMIAGITPVSAKAEETVSQQDAMTGNEAFGNVLTDIMYLDKDGVQQTCEKATVVTPEDTTWGTHTNGDTFEDVWYVVNRDVTIDGRVTVADRVHLILMNGCTLTVNGGIEVQKIGQRSSNVNVKLYVYAQSEKKNMGKLKTVSDGAAATIGSQPSKYNGVICFNGGEIDIENTGEGAAFGQGGGTDYANATAINGGRVVVKAKSSVMKCFNLFLHDTKYWRVTSENQTIEKGKTWTNILSQYCLTSTRMVFEPCTEHTGIEVPVYTDDKNHTKLCKWCGYAMQEEAHHYDEGNCDCGAIKTEYQTENGDTAYAGCLLLEDNEEGYFEFPDKWYVVPRDTTVHSLRNRFSANHDVNIIIAEEATLTLEKALVGNNNVSLYGKGTMMIKEGDIGCNNLTINDTELRVTSPDEYTSVVTVRKLILNRGRLNAICTANFLQAVVIQADSVQLKGDAELRVRGSNRAFSNDNVTFDPEKCWMIGLGRGDIPFNQIEEERVFTTYNDISIVPRTEGHEWTFDVNKGTHTCTADSCQKEIRHAIGYTADSSKRTISGRCLDICDLELGSVTLKTPEVPDGLTNIRYDGKEHEVQIIGTIISGTMPEITYFYQAPGEKTYTKMEPGTKPVAAGNYQARISLTGSDGKMAEVSVDFVIEKETPVVTWSETAKAQSVNYSGSAICKDAIIPPTVTLLGEERFVDMDKIEYSYRKMGETGDFVSGLPTYGGTYEVKASIPSIGNYKEATSTDGIQLTIQKGMNEFTTDLTCESYMYEKGKTPVPNIVAKFGKVIYKYALAGTEEIPTDEESYTTETPTNAGTYAVKAYVQETGNYTGLMSEAETFTIERSSETPNMPPMVLQPEHAIHTVGEAALPADWSWEEEEKEKVLADDTPVTATAVYTGEDKGNYITESIVITLTRSACNHEYGIPQYTWKTDDAGKVTCTASKTCTRVGCKDMEKNHTITETVTAVDAITKSPTCEVKGTKTYTAVFAKDGFTLQTKTEDIDVTAHKLTAVAAQDANATEAGNKAYFVCDVCGRYFEDCEGTKEITDKSSVVIPAKGITPTPTPTPSQPSTSPTALSPSVPTDKPSAAPITQSTKAPSTTSTVKPSAGGKTKDSTEITYKVTSKADKAFKNRKKVTCIIIGKDVTKIRKNAFAGCKNLKKIIIKTKKLTKKSVAKGAFRGVGKKVVVKVPKSKFRAYKKLLRARGLNKKIKIQC